MLHPSPLGHAQLTYVEPVISLDEILRNEADMAFRRRVRAVIEMLELQATDRVLDAGCGHGFYLRTLAELHRPWSVGVEFSEFWLHHARRELSNTDAHLVRGDLCRLPFGAGSFDKAIVSEVLEHVADDGVAVSELHRVLRPRATAVITVPHANYPLLWDPVNKLLETLWGVHLPKEPLWLGGVWADHYRLYRPDQIIGRLEQSGFAVIEVRHLTHYCIPFAHHLYYGLGKYLLLSGMLPRSLATAADRFRYRENRGSLLNPINLVVRLLRALDALNDRRNDYTSYLTIAVRAVRC